MRISSHGLVGKDCCPASFQKYLILRAPILVTISVRCCERPRYAPPMIKLTEKQSLQLRSEFFNLFNTPQFNNPNATVGPGFGTISSAGAPTTLQRVSREIQLAAKVTF